MWACRPRTWADLLLLLFIVEWKGGGDFVWDGVVLCRACAPVGLQMYSGRP